MLNFSARLAMMLFLSSMVHAQDTAESTETVAEKTKEGETSKPHHALEEVLVTASRRAQSAEDISASVTLITSKSLQESGNLTVVEGLRGQPGVFIQQTTPGQGIPIIRGLKGSEILHLVDGVRINNAFFRNSPNQYIALVDPRMLGRVEVLRGSGSSFYGSDAMGGVVNFLTRNASDVEGLSGSIIQNYASSNNSWVSHAQFDHVSDAVDVLVDMDYVDAGDLDTGAGDTLPTAYTSRAASVKLIGKSELQWMANLQYSIQPSTPRADELVAGYGEDEADSEQFLFKPNDRLFAHFKLRSEAPSNVWDSWEFHYASQLMHDNRLTQNLGSETIKTEQNRSLSHNITLQASIDKADVLWQYGLDYYKDTVNSAKQKTSVVDGIAVDSTSRFPDGAHMEMTGLWSSAEFEFSHALLTTVSLRYSQISTELPVADRGVGAKVDNSDFSGSLGFHLPLDRWSLNANIGRGFRAPNIFDMGTLGERPGNRFNVGNTNLQPEYLWSSDFGFRYQSNEWSGEWVVFYNDYQDKIVSIANGEITQDGRIVVQSENASSVIIYGAESMLKYDPEHPVSVEAVLNWSYGDSTFEGQTEAADRVPPLNLTIRFGWQFESGMQLAIVERLVARQNRLSGRDITDPRIDPLGTAGWAVTDITLTSEQENTLGWHVGLRNVFDKAYREHGSGIDGAGLGVVVGVTYHFD